MFPVFLYFKHLGSFQFSSASRELHSVNNLLLARVQASLQTVYWKESLYLPKACAKWPTEESVSKSRCFPTASLDRMPCYQKAPYFKFCLSKHLYINTIQLFKVKVRGQRWGRGGEGAGGEEPSFWALEGEWEMKAGRGLCLCTALPSSNPRPGSTWLLGLCSPCLSSLYSQTYLISGGKALFVKTRT